MLPPGFVPNQGEPVAKKRKPEPVGRYTAEEIQARQEPGAPDDGRFHHRVVVSATSEDWRDRQHDSMHNANRLAVLDMAMHRGLHPQEEARFDGYEVVPGNRGRDCTVLSYSVAVVPAAQADPASTVTVSKTLEAHGGTSQAD